MTPDRRVLGEQLCDSFAIRFTWTELQAGVATLVFVADAVAQAWHQISRKLSVQILS